MLLRIALGRSLVAVIAFTLANVAVVLPVNGTEKLREQLQAATDDGQEHSRIELIRRILDQEPGDAGLRGELVELWLWTGNHALAKAELEAWDAAPEPLRAMAGARILWETDEDGWQKPQALEMLRGFLNSQPGHLEATRQLAAYLQRSEPGELAGFLAESPLTTEHVDLLVMRAGARRDLSDLHGALDDFNAARRLDAEHPDVGRGLPSFERVEAMLPVLDEAESRLVADPDDFTGLMLRGYCRIFTEIARVETYADAQRVLETTPSSAAARLVAARTSPDRAARVFETYGVRANATLPGISSFRELLELDQRVAVHPEDVGIRVERAYHLNEPPKFFELALEDARQAVGLDAEHVGARIELIYASIGTDAVDDAMLELAVLRELEYEPAELARACNYLAEAELARRQYAEGLALATEAIELAPAARYYRTRAALYERLQRPADAAADLEKAEQLSDS